MFRNLLNARKPTLRHLLLANNEMAQRSNPALSKPVE
jgi:hypothetical protein